VTDPSCATAHGTPGQSSGSAADRVLVAVFASPVSSFLLRYAADAGFTTVLLEPDGARVAAAEVLGATTVGGFAELDAALPPGVADVVVTDHHREELGPLLRDALGRPVRWIGVMGNPRHEGPHVAALAALGVPAEEVARVRRPIGLDIGSRAPAEIAVATLAGLLADRNGRGGGFLDAR
jgi:xanthine dehydrogenase accessory factor